MPLEELVDPIVVRAAIDISLTEAELSDTIILLPIYRGAAVLEVQRRVSNAEDLAGEAQQRLRNALNLTTAALIVKAMPQIKRARTAEGDEFERVVEAAPDERLWQRAAEEISAIVGEDADTATQPTMFSLARGYRGR